MLVVLTLTRTPRVPLDSSGGWSQVEERVDEERWERNNTSVGGFRLGQETGFGFSRLVASWQLLLIIWPRPSSLRCETENTLVDVGSVLICSSSLFFFVG